MFDELALSGIGCHHRIEYLLQSVAVAMWYESICFKRLLRLEKVKLIFFMAGINCVYYVDNLVIPTLNMRLDAESFK